MNIMDYECPVIEEEQCNNCTIQIFEDDMDFVISPRDDGNLGTIVYKCRNYQLGEVEVEGKDDAWDYMFRAIADELSDEEWEKLAEAVIREDPDEVDDKDYQLAWYREFIENRNFHEYLIRRENDTIFDIMDDHLYYLPVYKFEHGMVTISTSPFSCPWDSGQIGYIFTTDKQVKDEGIDTTEVSPHKILQEEINEFDQYIQGEVYRFVVTENGTGKLIESCGNFLGDDGKQAALEEARIAAENKPQMELGIV